MYLECFEWTPVYENLCMCVVVVLYKSGLLDFDDGLIKKNDILFFGLKSIDM